MCLVQGHNAVTQVRLEPGHNSSVLSQALYHWATALPWFDLTTALKVLFSSIVLIPVQPQVGLIGDLV